MAVIEANLLPLHTKAPDFELYDVVSNKTKKLIDLQSEVATVIVFICNHCPFVQFIKQELANTAREYIAKGISFIAINPNDETQYQEDSPENMRLFVKKIDAPFPYLHDETQAVAKEYGAVCTPDFYVFDGNMLCVYHGQFDDSRIGSKSPVTGADLRNALDAILNKEQVSTQQKPSIGCSIKWKKN